jgi:putative spermidine/putrescine transport system ATP-binding protein
VSAGLEIRDLSVSPGGGEPVLSGVELSVVAGSRLVVAGPSGAGKTTLLRAIAGLERPVSGTIELAGLSVDGVPAHRREIAMVFQEPRLLPHLTVLDNVALPMRASGEKRDVRRSAAAERLAEVGLARLTDRRVGGLSGGEQQRVALARALCGDPRLLLLDEPLAALDPNRREDLRDLIVAVQQQRNLTTILVTHDRSEASEVGESIALMIDGRIEQQDRPAALFERPASIAVAEFFGNRNLIEVDGVGNGTWAIRPEKVVLGAGEREATVLEVAYRGSYTRVVLDWQGRQIEAHVPTGDAPPAGQTVDFELPREALWRIPGT